MPIVKLDNDIKINYELEGNKNGGLLLLIHGYGSWMYGYDEIVDGIDIEAKVILGRVADSIVHYVIKNGIDLIIIATHGRSGVSRWLRGSVANRILHAVRAPILMIPPPGQFEN